MVLVPEEKIKIFCVIYKGCIKLVLIMLER